MLYKTSDISIPLPARPKKYSAENNIVFYRKKYGECFCLRRIISVFIFIFVFVFIPNIAENNTK
ncbi:MAG: hypothetical protein CVT88_03720 [Candidatus Altiarchaeales archaeon HGW-Altiarchaeales-1]|nr:MAG: hypothetical protein CVT88_03720 [Candidatus Altiarchaeales archaeon HGW-Altiarchaeales-1]